MKVLTGSDLASGAVIWWTGAGWSIHVDEAVDVGAKAAGILAYEEAARRVTGGYVIDAERDANGVRPAHIKDRIRAMGPTVRPDLAVAKADPADREWVI